MRTVLFCVDWKTENSYFDQPVELPTGAQAVNRVLWELPYGGSTIMAFFERALHYRIDDRMAKAEVLHMLAINKRAWIEAHSSPLLPLN